MPMSFEQRLRVPADVLVSDLDGETVLLNLKTESYYGLDKIGTRMLTAVTAADSVEEAYNKLSREFDVERAQLRKDLADILDNLLDNGLLEVQ